MEPVLKGLVVLDVIAVVGFNVEINEVVTALVELLVLVVPAAPDFKGGAIIDEIVLVVVIKLIVLIAASLVVTVGLKVVVVVVDAAALSAACEEIHEGSNPFCFNCQKMNPSTAPTNIIPNDQINIFFHLLRRELRCLDLDV